LQKRATGFPFPAKAAQLPSDPLRASLMLRITFAARMKAQRICSFVGALKWQFCFELCAFDRQHCLVDGKLDISPSSVLQIQCNTHLWFYPCGFCS
jgi:hypothetical protein